MKMKNINPPTFMLLCLLSMLALHWLFPLWLISSWILLLLGMGCIVFGIMLGIAAEGQFRRSGTTVDHLGTPAKLVTNGWFKYSRNPMYLSFAVMLVGAWLVLGSFSPLFSILAYFVFTEQWYILPEEQRIASKFGKNYATYKKQTRRWL
jgi:protein-S-isoprenylcysteine O-methyltransferase Ste14